MFPPGISSALQKALSFCQLKIMQRVLINHYFDQLIKNVHVLLDHFILYHRKFARFIKIAYPIEVNILLSTWSLSSRSVVSLASILNALDFALPFHIISCTSLLLLAISWTSLEFIFSIQNLSFDSNYFKNILECLQFSGGSGFLVCEFFFFVQRCRWCSSPFISVVSIRSVISFQWWRCSIKFSVISTFFNVFNLSWIFIGCSLNFNSKFRVLQGWKLVAPL